MCESAGSRDRGLVSTSVSADGVGASVRLDGSKILGLAARIVVAVVLDNVVLGLGGVDPAVDCEVRTRAGGAVGGAVGDVAG